MRAGPVLVLLLAAFLALPAWGRSPGQGALDEGSAAYKQGRYREALASFRRAVELDPSLTRAWVNIGWAEHRLGDDREALRVWETVLKLEPRDVSTWNAVGEVQLTRDAGAAASAFEKSLALKPAQPDVRLRLGQAYESQGKLDAAESQYRKILAANPRDPKAPLRLADLQEKRGDLAAAEATLRAATGVPATLRLARVLGQRGDQSFRAGAWADAAAAYDEASALDPGRALYRVNLGWAALRAGDTARAVVAWNGAIAHGASDPSGLWRAIGDAERDAGRPAEAREAYARAAAADPRAASAIYALAALAMEEGDTAAAAMSLRRMFATAETGEDDAVRAADLFIRYGALDAGEAFFEELGRDTSHDTASAVALARVRAAHGGAAYRQGDDGRASAYYAAALQADPKNRAALRDYGWALWRQSDWAGVRRVWTAYIAAYPAMAEPRELMGRLELQQRDPKQAIERARQALELGGGTLSAKVLLTKAYLADGKFRQARTLAVELAGAYPDDLPVQTLYAETIWRSLDFAKAEAQWRKVLDLGSESPRATHYWLRSMYENGKYDEAIAAAEQLAATGSATEPVLRLLAEDALVRGDDAATERWYRELTARFPQRVPYWIALADLYRATDAFRIEQDVLEDAFALHPASPEIRLRLAGVLESRGRPKAALAEYEALRGRLGRNRSVFEGELHALAALGRYDEALALLATEGREFLDPDERALVEAAIQDDRGRRAEAEALRNTVLEPSQGRVILPVLLYHGISDHPRTLSVPIDRFEEEMQAIHDAGYTTITVSEMDAMLDGRRPFPPKPLLLTFDDARADSFRYADPILERLGMKATMFVPTVRIVDESVFNSDWATLVRLHASGRWDFQSHGHLAHDPIPIDAGGAMAEFLVNREWLADQGRLESHDEFVTRVEGDYALCRERLIANIPGQKVVAYAFPFSEMGQLHGGNDPEALDVNEAAFRRLYRYGFVQDTTGYNTLVPGSSGPLLLNRLNVRREWDGVRLLAHLASQTPAQRARLEAAQADSSYADYRDADRVLRGMIGSDPRVFPSTAPALAFSLHEQSREREAAGVLSEIPEGPAWGRPSRSQRKLKLDVAWEADPSAGGQISSVSDSDGRDVFEAAATGRYAFEAPVDLTARAGTVRFRDREFSSLSGFEATIGAAWVGGASIVEAGGWLRGRSLHGASDFQTINGELTLRGGVDGNRFGAACGVNDVDTVGALLNEIQRRGCQLSFDANHRSWRLRARLAYGSLTDGNRIGYGWSDALFRLASQRNLEVGGRLELGDSRETSTLYYAPSGLVTALGIVRYSRSFPSGATLDTEAGAGPSRDTNNSARLVGHARLGWTQDWSPRWRSRLSAEYSQTPDYRRTSASFSFGYRF